MPINSKYLFVASMDVDPDKEALFNEIYDAEHVPNLLKVYVSPGNGLFALVQRRQRRRGAGTLTISPSASRNVLTHALIVSASAARATAIALPMHKGI